eukprot:6173259-Pleurochrysis_carterae.AAC.3
MGMEITHITTSTFNFGYIITHDGMKANPEKGGQLDQTPDCLRTKKHVLRFIRRIGHLANPLYELLRKKVKESKWPWKPDASVETCRYKRAFEAVANHCVWT